MIEPKKKFRLLENITSTNLEFPKDVFEISQKSFHYVKEEALTFILMPGGSMKIEGFLKKKRIKIFFSNL